MATHDEGDGEGKLGERFRAVEPAPAEGDEGPLPGGPALRPDGQITGRTKAVEPPPRLDFGDVPLSGEDAQLELVERAPKRVEPPVEVFRPEPPSPRRRLAVKIVIAAVALAVLLFGLAVTVPRKHLSRVGLEGFLPAGWTLGELTRSASGVPLLIESTPAGATITVAGNVIGVTPWAGDNHWAEGAPVTLTLAGYAPWTGLLRAEQEQHLTVKLKPRGKVTVDVEVGPPAAVEPEKP